MLILEYVMRTFLGLCALILFSASCVAFAEIGFHALLLIFWIGSLGVLAWCLAPTTWEG